MYYLGIFPFYFTQKALENSEKPWPLWFSIIFIVLIAIITVMFLKMMFDVAKNGYLYLKRKISKRKECRWHKK